MHPRCGTPAGKTFFAVDEYTLFSSLVRDRTASQRHRSSPPAAVLESETMKRISTDVAIIGAGTAGLNARREVDKAGLRWVLIENGPYGTTCARVGCMPSKLLIAAADAAQEVRHAGDFGIRVEPEAVRIDGVAVMERVRRERDRFAGFVVEFTEAIAADRRVRGTARFVGPTSLHVDDHTEVNARAVVIATGSAPWIPPQLDPVREHVIVNDDVFDWTDLPASVAVVGTGVIGLELGQALHRLGVRVTLFNPFDELGPLTDPKVVDVARRVFRSELDLQLKSQMTRIEHDGAQFQLGWETAEGQPREAAFDQVLVAAGRRPNVRSLGLEAAGLEIDKRGVPVHDDQTMQCGTSSVFIAGDVCGHLPLLHEAADEGRIAGRNAARYPDVVAAVRRTNLAVAFTDPQIGIVGSSYRNLDVKDLAMGEVSYDDQGRARVMGKNAGLVRIYADRRSCRLVGAEMFGPRVEHTAHGLAWLVQQGVRAQEAVGLPFYHPVIEEGIRTALRQLANNLKVSGLCPPEDSAEAAGD